jgi:hypothetical protein
VICDPSYPPCARPDLYTSVLGPVPPTARDAFRRITAAERASGPGWRGRQMKEYEQTGRLPAADIEWYRQHSLRVPLPGNWCGVPAELPRGYAAPQPQAVCPPLYGCVQGTGAPPLCAPDAHARWWAGEGRPGLGEVPEAVTRAQNVLAHRVLGAGKPPRWWRGLGVTGLSDGRWALKLNVSRMSDMPLGLPREVLGVPVVVDEVGDITPRASYDFWRRATGLGMDKDQAAKYGGLTGAVIGGGSVLALGAYLGRRASSPQHKTRGTIVGLAIAAVPAYVAAMMGGMLGGGIASGQSPV